MDLLFYIDIDITVRLHSLRHDVLSGQKQDEKNRHVSVRFRDS